MANRMIIVVMVFVYSAGVNAQYQATPEEMMGTLRVNGKDSGTAYLVADRVIITCAHCLYNPPHGYKTWPVRPSMVEYLSCKRISQSGQSICRGIFRASKIVWQSTAWRELASSVGSCQSAEYIERSRLDYAVILLDRAPLGLGHFIASADDVPAKYFDGGLQEAGYPRVANGMPWVGVVSGAEFFQEREWFSADGLNARDSQGTSGGPFFYKNDDGKWVAFAIHNYAGSIHATNWTHRRITPEIVSAIEMLAGR